MIISLEIKGLCRRTCSTHASRLVSCSLPINNNNSNIKSALVVSLCENSLKKKKMKKIEYSKSDFTYKRVKSLYLRFTDCNYSKKKIFKTLIN